MVFISCKISSYLSGIQEILREPNRKRARIVTGCLLSWLGFAPVLVAQHRPESLPVSADLEARLEAIRVKHSVPGLAAAATSGEKLLVIGAAGFRKADAPEKVTVHDLWHLGSCTKSMTATMLARLVERGTMRWDMTIGEVFPHLAASGRMKDAYKPVTIEMLLAHRGGIPSDLSENGLWGHLWEKKGTPTEQRQQLLEGVMVREPMSKPGTAFLYSNAGIAIAGHMAEKITGKAWEELMEEEMFAPLGMKHVGFGAPGDAAKMDEPWGHHGPESKPVAPGPNADNPPAIGPAGTMHAALVDWAKYAAVHLLGARGKTDYLKPQTFARLQAKPKVGDYAFGWAHAERGWGGGDVLSHNGSNLSWFCVVWMAPKKDVAYLAACNCAGDGGPRATDDAVQALMAVLREAKPSPKKEHENGRARSPLDEARRIKAQAECDAIKAAVEMYRLQNKSGKLPEVSDYPRCLLEPGPEGHPLLDPATLPGGRLLDPWGHEYVYLRNGNSFEIVSYGSDGVPGGEGDAADISSKRR